MARDFRLHHAPVDVLNYEVAQEKAVALGRMGRALEEALAKLEEFDAAHPRSGAPTSAQQARRKVLQVLPKRFARYGLTLHPDKARHLRLSRSDAQVCAQPAREVRLAPEARLHLALEPFVEQLVMEAGYALWMFVVQREACGLRDSRAVMRDYNVPGEVQRSMGAVLATNAR